VTQTTLTWGEPFYTKVHTAVVSGQTPDVFPVRS
jgi:multiple sugar transport system substrate-binding protein